jgi:hypothetical protein
MKIMHLELIYKRRGFKVMKLKVWERASAQSAARE